MDHSEVNWWFWLNCPGSLLAQSQQSHLKTRNLIKMQDSQNFKHFNEIIPFKFDLNWNIL